MSRPSTSVCITVEEVGGWELFSRSPTSRQPCEWCVYVGVLAAVGGTATLAAIPLQAFRITDHPQALVNTGIRTGVIESNYGISALVRLTGVVLLLVAVTRLRLGHPAVVAGLVNAFVSALSFVVMGHSGTSQPRAGDAAAEAAPPDPAACGIVDDLLHLEGEPPVVAVVGLVVQSVPHRGERFVERTSHVGIAWSSSDASAASQMHAAAMTRVGGFGGGAGSEPGSGGSGGFGLTFTAASSSPTMGNCSAISPSTANPNPAASDSAHNPAKSGTLSRDACHRCLATSHQ